MFFCFVDRTGSLPADLGRLTEVSKVDFSCNLLGGEFFFFAFVSQSDLPWGYLERILDK